MEEHIQSLLDRVNTNIRRTNTGIVVTIITISAGLLFLLFHQPAPPGNSTKLVNDALEEVRSADMKLVTVKLDSVRTENRAFNEKFEQHENELKKKLEENTKALKQTRDEKPVDYSSYNNVQLQSAVSDLVRQYQAAKFRNPGAAANR